MFDKRLNESPLILHRVPRIVTLISKLAIECACALACRYLCQPYHKFKQLFTNSAFFIYMGEELSQPTKHANKIILTFIIKAKIIETHGIFKHFLSRYC